MKLCEKLYELRRAAGLSQEELAERLNVSRQAVSKWENGAAQPELSKLVELSRLYGVSVDELLSLEEAEKAAGAVEEEAAEASGEEKGLSGWILGVGEKLNGAVDQAKKALGRFVDAVAVLIIINCVIPVLVLWFFLWLIKTAFSVDIHVPADRFLPGR